MERKTTKSELAAEAAAQLTYILSALGLADDYGAAVALRAALESRASLRCAAGDVAAALSTIKRAVRELVDADTRPVHPVPCAPGCRVCPDTDRARDHHAP